MEKERTKIWDNLKFFLITLVVMGHFVNDYIEATSFKSIFLFIHTFHMPLFFFISGLFHKNINIRKKVFDFVSIGYLSKIFIFVTIVFICRRETNFYLLSEGGLPWFMFSLALFVLVTYLLRDADYKKVLFFAILLGCFVNYDQKLGDFLVLSRTLVFFPFYYLGSILDRKKIESLAKNKYLKITSIIIILIWIFICIYKIDLVYVLRPIFTGKNAFSDEIYPYGFLYRIICYTLTVIISFALICVTPNKKIPIISEYGKRTIQVYFWHRPILYIFTYVFHLNTILCATASGKLLFLLISIILTFILSTNIFSFPTNLVLKSKKSKRV